MRGLLTITLIVVGIALIWQAVTNVSPALAAHKGAAATIITEIK